MSQVLIHPKLIHAKDFKTDNNCFCEMCDASHTKSLSKGIFISIVLDTLLNKTVNLNDLRV